jgi:carnitine-CoA ligase
VIVRFEDLSALVGTVVEGEPFTVSREERDAFEDVTWITRAYPKELPAEFPGDIVEGFHSLALLDAVLTMAAPPLDTSMYGYNYGLDRVRFTAPIRIGDRVHSRFEVREVRPKDEGLLVLRHCELTVEGADRPALVADWWVYLLPSG